MRMSQEEKQLSHERIVASAAAMVRRRGVEGTSVSDVMRDAGLTHGGFYKHFESKDALLEAALDRAFDEIAARLQPDRSAADAVRANRSFDRFYLSMPHVDSPGAGCPVAAVGGDVARASADTKRSFAAGFRRIVDLLARGGAGSAEARRVRAIRRFAMLSGAVTIARACDAATAREVLAACRRA